MSNNQYNPQEYESHSSTSQNEAGYGFLSNQNFGNPQGIYVEDTVYQENPGAVPYSPVQSQYYQQFQDSYPQPEYYQDSAATAVYPSVVASVAEEGHKESKKSPILWVTVAVLLTLLVVAGVLFGLNRFGYFSFGGDEKPVSVSTQSSATAKSSVPIPTETITSTSDSVNTPSPTHKLNNMNEPDAAAETIATGVKRLNQDSGIPFTKDVAENVRAHTFVPDETYVIHAYSEAMSKGFTLECEAPSTIDGWVHCSGLDTKGNVQIWVRPRN